MTLRGALQPVDMLTSDGTTVATVRTLSSEPRKDTSEYNQSTTIFQR